MSGEPTMPGDFTTQARYYASARPAYPDALIDALMQQVGARPGALTVDVGAGTGISSRLLARHGLRVIAVEPNAAMSAQAEADTRVDWQAGTFEDTGLPDATADWVVAAQAFHWADPLRALPEMRRILKDGGWFTIFWNDRDTASSPLLTETLQIIQSLVPDYEERYGLRDWAAELQATGDFSSVQALELRHTVPMKAGRFMNLWRSHNRLNSTAGPRRFAQIMGKLQAMLDGRGESRFDVPYLCRAWSVQRR
jgi:SAM-dependent methyltransferase